MAGVVRVNQVVAHHGRSSRAEVAVFPRVSPVLSLHLDGVRVTITSWRAATVTSSDVKFARELARCAVAYAMEIERRHSLAAA